MIIGAEDTNILVLCLAVSIRIPCPIYQKCDTKNRTRYLDITKIFKTVGSGVCDALVGTHAFTGCDSISAFAGRGKTTGFKLLKSDKTKQEVFNQLGHSWDLTAELFQRLQQITCQMYLLSTRTTEVNKLRYQLFCAKPGDVDSS